MHTNKLYYASSRPYLERTYMLYNMRHVHSTLFHYYGNTAHRGNSLTVQKKDVSASTWMDKKVVMVKYSNCQSTETGSGLRRQKNGSRIAVTCPTAIISYNQHMGGVDRGDQVRGYYSCRTRCRKFYKYIFHFLLDVSITNAFILQKHYCPDMSFQHVKDFRLQLAKELIGDYCSRKRAGRGVGTMCPLPLRHFPSKIPVDEGSLGLDKHKRGRCWNTRTQSVKTPWFCRECNVWLCHTGESSSGCFLTWHTQRQQ